MRIISGKYRSIALDSPIDDNVRPTTDRVKENVFNLIQNEISGRKCLDLFAGSGAIGIECLSRYAECVFFNDVSQKSVKLLRTNLDKLKDCDNYAINVGEWKIFLETTNEKFDLIYLDPPFNQVNLNNVLEVIEKNNILNNDGIIVIECEKDFKFNTKFEIEKQKKYGRIYITILRNEND